MSPASVQHGKTTMKTMHAKPHATAYAALAAVAASALLLFATHAMAAGNLEWSGRKPVTAELTGGKEVPPVSTQAYGKSTIKVARDRTVSGSVIVFDMKPTSAHIHWGAMNQDGPVIIPLNRVSDSVFSVPPKARLTEEQYARFREGNLYINVHSDRFPTGEIRAQMKH